MNLNLNYFSTTHYFFTTVFHYSFDSKLERAKSSCFWSRLRLLVPQSEHQLTQKIRQSTARQKTLLLENHRDSSDLTRKKNIWHFFLRISKWWLLDIMGAHAIYVIQQLPIRIKIKIQWKKDQITRIHLVRIYFYGQFYIQSIIDFKDT